MKPPTTVVDNCRAGLAARIRCRCGGTEAAVRFATMMVESGDLADDKLPIVAEAHRRLDQRLIQAGVESEAHHVEWLLWGGREAAEWAQLAERVDAELLRSPLDELSNRFQSIDERAFAKLETLIETLMAQALKSTGAILANAACGPKASKRYRDQMVAELGPVGYERLKTEICAAPKIQVPSMLPSSIRAQFDEREQAQVQKVLEDLGPAVRDIVEEAYAETDRALQEVLELTDDDIPQNLRPIRQEDEDRTVLFLAAALFALAGQRLNNPEPEAAGPAGVTFGPNIVPPNIVRSALGIAGGLPASVDGVTRDFDDALTDLLGRPAPTGIASGTRTTDVIDRAIRKPSVRVRVNIPDNASVVVTQTWRSTKREFKPHTRLNGKTWTTEAERVEVCRAPSSEWPYVDVYRANPNADHKGCGCFVQSKLRLGV